MAAKKRPNKAERGRARRGRVLDKMVQGAEDASFYEKLDVTLDEVVPLEDEDSAANSPVSPIGSTVASSHERDMQQEPRFRAAVLAHESEAEDEAALGKFLSFLAQDAALHPERLGDVGELVAGDDQLLEGVEAQWLWLVERPHPWRRQPWIKGRRLTVGDVLGRMKIEGWSPEETAKEMDLPIEAVKEALAWAKAPDTAALIAAEDAKDTLAADSVAPALAEEAASLEMTYELWDFETGNAQGVYRSLLDALTVVRKALERDGHETLTGLALVEVHSGGHRRLLARGQGLSRWSGSREPATSPPYAAASAARYGTRE